MKEMKIEKKQRFLVRSDFERLILLGLFSSHEACGRDEEDGNPIELFQKSEGLTFFVRRKTFLS